MAYIGWGEPMYVLVLFTSVDEMMNVVVVSHATIINESLKLQFH